jgi:hypothetical protein
MKNGRRGPYAPTPGTPQSWLKTWRVRADFTQEDLAKLLDVSKGYISQLEGLAPQQQSNGRFVHCVRDRALILRWASACGVAMTHPEVKRCLAEHGHVTPSAVSRTAGTHARRRITGVNLLSVSDLRALSDVLVESREARDAKYRLGRAVRNTSEVGEDALSCDEGVSP